MMHACVSVMNSLVDQHVCAKQQCYLMTYPNKYFSQRSMTNKILDEK